MYLIMHSVSEHFHGASAEPLGAFLESTIKINMLGEKSVEGPGKPNDSEELALFRQIALLYIIDMYIRGPPLP